MFFRAISFLYFIIAAKKLLCESAYVPVVSITLVGFIHLRVKHLPLQE